MLTQKSLEAAQRHASAYGLGKHRFGLGHDAGPRFTPQPAPKPDESIAGAPDDVSPQE